MATVWLQPILTSNTSYGIVSAENYAAGYEPWMASNGTEKGWSSSNSVPGWWMWKLPQPIRIKKITLLNRYSGSKQVTKTADVFADETMTQKIGSVIFEDTASSTKEILLETPVVTDTVKVNCLSSYGTYVGIGEITIDADISWDDGNRFLIQGVDNTLYNIQNDVLTALETLEPFSENFIQNGMSEVSSGNWINELTDYKILYWQASLSETVPSVHAKLTAYPNNQIVLTQEYDMGHESILGLSSMTADIDGTVSITLTFDHNATWWAFNGTQWAQTTQDNGMTKEVLNAITTEQWADLLTQVNGSLVYRLSLVIDETTAVRRIDVKYINP